jgi:sporulation protein YlmC with PRC-barrel domain
VQTRQAIEPLDLKIGSAVQCRDGRAGRVIKLVVEPGSKRVTHIVVERGLLLHHDAVVPIERVAPVEGGTVVLDMDGHELNAQPAYAEVDYAVPDPSWTAQYGHAPDDTLVDLRSYAPTGLPLVPAWSGMIYEHTHEGVPAEEIPLGRGTRVSCRDGALGWLDHVLLDPESGAVRALVVRKDIS